MTASSHPQKPFWDWLDSHDDRWAFMVLYIGGSVLLSIFASLFWVAMLVVMHFMLELFRHRQMRPGAALAHALWHLKLDVALIFFALVLSLYGDMIFAALGLGQAARAANAVRGMQMATRFAVIERGIRVFLLTVDDLARVMRVVLRVASGRNKAAVAQGRFQPDALQPDTFPSKDVHFQARQGEGTRPSDGQGSGKPLPADHETDAEDPTPWRAPGRGDVFALCFGALCLLLVLGAPVLRGQTGAEILAVIAAQMSP